MSEDRAESKFAARRPADVGRQVVCIVLFAVLLYIAALLADGTTVAERGRLLRVWGLLAAAVFAVSVPHVLLPDPDWQLLQLLNRSPRRLLFHQLRRWSAVVALFLVPCAALAYYDPGQWVMEFGAKTLLLLQGVFVVAGIGLYSFERYVTIGRVSQEWQEGKRGKSYRWLAENTPLQPVGLPDGMIPALLVTSHVFVVGAVVVVLGVYAGLIAGPALAWVPALALILWAGAVLRRHLPVYDRDFYCTNAFYVEIFRMAGGVRVSDREPIPYAAVYWVPGRWRAHVWAGLRQLDRKMPLGRLIALGHLLLWVLFYQDAAPAVITSYLLLFAATKNAAVFLLTTEPFAPEPFQITLQSHTGWALTRFFLNLRWTLPWLLSLLLVAWMHPEFGAGDALAWTGVDVLLALITASIFTLLSEAQYRKRFA